jgi:hypothetical protein
MIGGLKSPFRLPCAGSVSGTPQIVIKTVSGSPVVDAYGNTTQMLDHCGNTIPADKRFYQTNTCGDDICAPNCSDCPGGTDLVTNTPEPPAISANTWLKIGKMELPLTRKLGGKWVQAFKSWQGQFDFNTNSGTDCATGLVRSNTRYRTRTMQASDVVISGPYGAGTWTSARTITVKQLSGERTMTSCSDTTDSPTVPAPPDYQPATDLASNPACTLDVDGIATRLGRDCDPDSVVITTSGSYGSITTGAIKTLEITTHRTATHYDWTEVGRDAFTGDITFTYSGSIDLSDAYTIDDVLSDAKNLANEWQLNNDLQFLFSTNAHTTVAPLVINNELPVATPDTYPASCTVDDYQNPTDDADGNAPFSAGWNPTWLQIAWFDPSAYQWTFPPGDNQYSAAATGRVLLYDGAIIGSPLPAGYGQPVGGNPQGVFDKDHENYFRRNCTLTVGWTQANESRGAFTPNYLPSNAQKWTDDFQATSLYPCAFANADVNGVYLQKWCEIQIPRPSINFARPFGPDKFALEETQVFFMSDFTAGVVTLQNLDFSAVTSLPFTGADVVGNAALGGFYAVASVGTNTVTLGAKVYGLPAGYQTPSDDAHFCFGKLRFPNAPGMDFTDTTLEIGGRVAVTVADGTTQTNITTATVQKYLSLGVNPETVDILDATMAPLATNVDLIRDTDSAFHVATAFATISAAKWIVPHVLNNGTTSGQKYKFADSRSKGDYVYRTWTVRIIDATLLASTQQDACLGANPCGPPVVGITPNGETSISGHFWPFPTSINNGEVWLAQVQFWMPDPFWQAPHVPCAVDDSQADFVPGTDQIAWAEDNGGCAENFTSLGGAGETIYHRFYAMRPYVEARITLPDNIGGETPPALASGTDLTAAVDHPGQAFIGDVEGPLVNAIVLPTPTWVKYLLQKACVDAEGVFANDYRANGTT